MIYSFCFYIAALFNRAFHGSLYSVIWYTTDEFSDRAYAAMITPWYTFPPNSSEFKTNYSQKFMINKWQPHPFMVEHRTEFPSKITMWNTGRISSIVLIRNKCPKDLFKTFSIGRDIYFGNHEVDGGNSIFKMPDFKYRKLN